MHRFILLAASAAIFTAPALAANITQEQTCQRTAEHVIDILRGSDRASAAKAEVKTLKGFSQAMQTRIDAGVKSSATDFNMDVGDVQMMVDQQGAAIDGQLEQRYGTDRLYRDYTVQLMNCAKLFPNDLGTDAASFEKAADQIGTWSMQDG